MPSDKRIPELITIQEMFKQTTGVPYCTGTVQLDAAHSTLFYRSNDRAKFIDFANPTKARLKSLTDACFLAAVLRNQEEVVDEGLCKAGEMHSMEFSTQFSPWDSGVFKSVIDTLFKANESVADVTYELCKLNVYGAGCFCKSHVDTPRSDTMIGSLIVVLPTPHIGGTLLIRHRRKKYTLDSVEAVSGDGPRATFAAFLRDIECEVAEVTSGHLVTLTYHLYRTASNPSSISPGITVQNQTSSNLQGALASLLSSPKFLPEGGLLAFGLSHEYPFDFKADRKVTKLSDMRKHFKGIDALVAQACEALKLEASLKVAYASSNKFCNEVCGFMDKFLYFSTDDECGLEVGVVDYCREHPNAIVGYNALSIDDYNSGDGDDILGVFWVMPPKNYNVFKEQYADISDGYDGRWDKKTTMAWAYGMVCLVVRIQLFNKRGYGGTR